MGRPLDVITRRSQDVRSGRLRDGQIGSLEDVLGMLERDILGTSWGPTFTSWEKRMDTLFLNAINSRTFDPHRLLLNLKDKINLKRIGECVAL